MLHQRDHKDHSLGETPIFLYGVFLSSFIPSSLFSQEDMTMSAYSPWDRFDKDELL